MFSIRVSKKENKLLTRIIIKQPTLHVNTLTSETIVGSFVYIYSVDPSRIVKVLHTYGLRFI